VQAGCDRDAVQRTLLLEALADALQHGHLPVGPFDPGASFICKAYVFDICFNWHLGS
jgi:hypothetical protein